MILSQFAKIMRDDFRKGRGLFRILRKSAFRWYRWGWDGMCEWLDKESAKIPDSTRELIIGKEGYRRWIKSNETANFHSGITQNHILFSIVLPLKTVNVTSIRVIESVLGQYYPNWELLLILDTPSVKQWADSRIHVFQGEGEFSYSDRWNEGLMKGRGEWILFLREAMQLSPHALLEFAAEIGTNSEKVFYYCDEDRLDSDGERHDPYFKSDFNPDLVYSISYIGSAFGCQTSFAKAIGGYRQEAEGCLEYDFLLRIWEAAGEKGIGHIRKIVFHIEETPEGTGQETRCEREMLLQHLLREGKKVRIEEDKEGGNRHLLWDIPEPLPFVSIVIPTRDHLELLYRCIESIRQKTTFSSYEIIIVDNQSQEDETIRYLEACSEDERIKVLEYGQPFNYSAINNYAVDHAMGEIIVLLNNDVEVISPDWLSEMVSHACRPEIGCVGALLYYPDDTIQHGGVILGLGDVAGHAHKYMVRGSSGYRYRAGVVQNYSAVTAACLAIRKALYTDVGGLDENHLRVAYNDVDLCLKVREAGYRNLWTPYAQLYHHESKSRGKDNTPEKKERYRSEVTFMHQRWEKTLEDDPYYHPMLTKIAEQFQLKRL
ncbi:MAG: glycosyltransferase [Sulfuricurvum sp.]